MLVKKLRNCLTDVFKTNKTLTEITTPKVSIKEPTLSFVNTVKANPSRFTFERFLPPEDTPVTSPTDPYHQAEIMYKTRRYCQKVRYRLYLDWYKFTDKELGTSYEITVVSSSVYGSHIPVKISFDSPNHITCNDDRLKFITQLEWLYIEEQLYLPYITRLKEIHNKKVTRKSLNNYRRLGRERKEREIINKSQREEYCNIYCKGED